MEKPDIIIIGGSLGSLEALEKILKDMQPNKNIPIVCLVHRLKNAKNLLESVLKLFNPNFNYVEIMDKMPIEKGVFYICPSDYHVLFENNSSFSLDYSEPVNYSRPSIDVLFESAAENFKGKILGVLLSGSNKDGMNGCKKLFEKNQQIIIQDPKTCENDLMTGVVFANKTYTMSLDPLEIKLFLTNLLT